MQNRKTFLLFAVCALAWAAIVLHNAFTAKGTEDFVITVTHPEVQAFAREQLDALQARSFTDGREYCSVIFENSEGGLDLTRILTGHAASCDLIYFDEPGMRPVASIHTHGRHDPRYDGERPSLTDLESDIAEGIDGYVSTPGGRLWHLDHKLQIASQVCGEGCLAQDPGYAGCDGSGPPQRYSLGELRWQSERGRPVC